jgi:hypothetical protein
MTPSPSTPLTTTSPHYAPSPWVSWGAVIAGGVIAVAIQIALSELCIGSGLALYEPTDGTSSGAGIAAGTAIAWLVCALLSIFVGGWVSGRMKRHGTNLEAAVHGALVWGLAALLTAWLTTVSLGMLTNGAWSLLGQGVSAAAKGAGAALPAVTEVVAPSWDNIRQQLEGGMTRMEGQGANQPAQPANENRYRERSRLMQLMGQAFNMNGQGLSEPERNEINQLLASQLGITPEAAQLTMDQWQRTWNESLQRFQTAKEEAKQTALQVATTVKRRTAQAAIIGFFIMMAGMGAAIAGAVWGFHCHCSKRARIENNELPVNQPVHA